MSDIKTLKVLWQKFLGELPTDAQFELWLEMHAASVVRHGIIKTAQKNMSMQNAMSADHKIRFASKVMNGYASQKAVNISTQKGAACSTK